MNGFWFWVGFVVGDEKKEKTKKTREKEPIKKERQFVRRLSNLTVSYPNVKYKWI